MVCMFSHGGERPLKKDFLQGGNLGNLIKVTIVPVRHWGQNRESFLSSISIVIVEFSNCSIVPLFQFWLYPWQF